jgi:hypothetical protein
MLPMHEDFMASIIVALRIGSAVSHIERASVSLTLRAALVALSDEHAEILYSTTVIVATTTSTNWPNGSITDKQRPSDEHEPPDTTEMDAS